MSDESTASKSCESQSDVAATAAGAQKVSQAEAAAQLGVNRSTVSRDVRRLGVQVDANGHFDFEEYCDLRRRSHATRPPSRTYTALSKALEEIRVLARLMDETCTRAQRALEDEEFL